MTARRYRIAAPVVVAALIGIGASVPRMDASAAAPRLPAITTSHLITKALSERVSHLSGTVRWAAALGLPSLSGLTSAGGQSVPSSSAFSPTSLLSGTQDFRVWIAGADRQRIALPSTLQETDVVRNGNQAWVWDSNTAHVTHYILAGTRGSGAHVEQPSAVSNAQQVTPQAVAGHVLSGLQASTTSVSVGSPVTVAGRSAYVLRLAPDRNVVANRASTVSSIDIAVDASTGLVLRVSVYAIGQRAPALQVGFTSIDYSVPSAADLSAPHGVTTSTKVLRPSGKLSSMLPKSSPSMGKTKVVGSDWGSIFSLSGAAVYRGASGATSQELQAVTTVVSGRWGSGRLLTSSLVNALFLPDGRVLVGFTTPAALEHAATGLAS